MVSKITSRRQARKIMEKKLGRKLDTFEYVHHKDGNPFNNDVENLEVKTPKTHSIVHNQSENNKGKLNPMYGRKRPDRARMNRERKGKFKHSKKSIEKMRTIHQELYRKGLKPKLTMRGKKHSDKTKKLMSKIATEKNFINHFNIKS